MFLMCTKTINDYPPKTQQFDLCLQDLVWVRAHPSFHQPRHLCARMILTCRLTGHPKHSDCFVLIFSSKTDVGYLALYVGPIAMYLPAAR